MVESHRATDGRTWGQLLESERARRHLLPAAAARAVGVCLDTWNDWVTGKSHPTGYQRNGVYTTFRTMRAFEALLLREHGELKEQERQRPLTFKPFAVVAPPKTIVKVLQGKTVRGNAGDRARAACIKAGLLKEEEIA